MLIFELILISRQKKNNEFGAKNNLLKNTGYKIKPGEGGRVKQARRGRKWPRLQNSRVFFFSKSVKKPVKRGVRVFRARSAWASHARSRPFVWLLARTWIRKIAFYKWPLRRPLVSWCSFSLTGAPNVNFWKISVRRTIWDLEFWEHLLQNNCLLACLS